MLILKFPVIFWGAFTLIFLCVRVSVCMCVASVREQCIQAGLVGALVPHLQSKEQEMLLNTGRAIGRICFDNGEGGVWGLRGHLVT